MTITRQRIVLIGFLLMAFLVHQVYLANTPPFPCDRLRASPLHKLDFDTYSNVQDEQLFIQWLGIYYGGGSGANAKVEKPYVRWSEAGVQYSAYFQDEVLESIEVNTYPFHTDAKVIMSCFGPPSEAVSMATRHGNIGTINLNYIWYDDLRIFMLGTAPTGAPEGTLAPLDETAEVRSFFIYSPSVYEREKR